MSWGWGSDEQLSPEDRGEELKPEAPRRLNLLKNKMLKTLSFCFDLF